MNYITEYIKSERSIIAAGLALAAGIIMLIFLVSGYFTPSEREEVRDYSDPVAFDFEQIMERGSIRMITRYNSSSYFLHRGMDRGFEYEMVSKFAEDHGLHVEVVLLTSDDDPIELLNSGAGDLIAGNYAVTSTRKPHIAFSRPYNFVNQVLVQPDNQEMISEISQLDGTNPTFFRTGICWD